MFRIPALCVTAISKTPPSFQDWGRNRLHSLLQELSRTLYFRKVLNPRTMRVRQGLGPRRVLGTVVNTSTEAQLARKELLVSERILRFQKVKRVLSSLPRGETGLELCTAWEKATQGGGPRTDLKSECRRRLGRSLTFQGSAPGVLSGPTRSPPHFMLLETFCNVH